MPDFRLVADFEPTGDQPAAIERLVDGLEGGLRHQTLLGVTGSGKTWTIALAIVQVLPEPVTPSRVWWRRPPSRPSTRRSIAAGWSPVGSKSATRRKSGMADDHCSETGPCR